MTKVGFYSICRVFGGIFGSNAGALANLAIPWIWPLAIATIAMGSIGVYAATSLRRPHGQHGHCFCRNAADHFVMAAGNLFVGFYYLLHSTVVTGALFLIADQIGTQRGIAVDQIVRARPVSHARLLGGLFPDIAAIAAVGLPPLSGFVGKALFITVGEPVCGAGVGVAGPA
jgi:multicomponent K+:H+ antiporter subunit D